MVHKSITRLAATFLALALVTSFAVAPVAAQEGDDGGSGIDIGGEDGISVGTDGVSVGGDDGVNVSTDGVDVGGENGVNVGTDGVEVGDSSIQDGENPVSPSGDGVDVGGEDGISVGTDGLNVGGEGVSIGTDGVDVGGEDGVNAGPDGVEVGDRSLDEGGLPGDGELPGSGDLPAPGDGELPGIGELPAPGEGLLPSPGNGSLPGFGELPGTGDLPSPGEGDAPDVGGLTELADSENGTVDTGALPVLETLSPALEQAPTGELAREFDSESLPAGTEDVLGPVPFEQVPVQPQDSPIGSESTIDCAFPVRGNDLPLDAVPGPDQLPVSPNLPGVPTSLLTPETVGGIALGVPPDGCEAYDPDDPSVDPSDPPTAFDFQRRNLVSQIGGDGIVWADEFRAETEQGQGGTMFSEFMLTNEMMYANNDLSITDGQTDDYVGLETTMESDRDFSNSSARAEVILFGSGIGGNLVCDDPVSADSLDPERLQNGELECEATPEGLLQPPLGPEEIADTIQDPPVSEEPPIDMGEIPLPISDIINL